MMIIQQPHAFPEGQQQLELISIAWPFTMQ
jgi:hypothetical protein